LNKFNKKYYVIDRLRKGRIFALLKSKQAAQQSGLFFYENFV